MNVNFFPFSNSLQILGRRQSLANIMCNQQSVNTINVNYMTRAYNQYQQKNAAKDQEKEDTRFADSVREKSEASGSIVGNSKIGSVSAKDMTMVEYKQYIYNSDKMIGGTEVCTLVLV